MEIYISSHDNIYLVLALMGFHNLPMISTVLFYEWEIYFC